MSTTPEVLDDHHIKFTIDVDEARLGNAIDSFVHELQRTAKIKGFRPGKVPRTVLEAHIGGSSALRAQAMEDVISDAYVEALNESSVEPLSDPQIEIIEGRESGDLKFEAIVVVRPSVSVAGYQGLEVAIPDMEVTEEEVETAIDRVREQWAELSPKNGEAMTGDVVTLDVNVSSADSDLSDTSFDDYVYEVGKISEIPKLDEHIIGAAKGSVIVYSLPVVNPDSLSADGGAGADGADEEVGGAGADGADRESGEDDADGQDEARANSSSEDAQAPSLEIKVIVKEIEERVLPELTDEWVQGATEYQDVDSMRVDVHQRLLQYKKTSVRSLFPGQVLSSLNDLVGEEPPAELVEAEFGREVANFSKRMEEAKMTWEQFIEGSGDNGNAILGRIHESAVISAKTDLALRAVADAEEIGVDESLDGLLSQIAKKSNKSLDEVREHYEHSGQLLSMRSELRKEKALDWLLRNVHVRDGSGNEIDNGLLLSDDSRDDDSVYDGESADDSDSASSSGKKGTAEEKGTAGEEGGNHAGE
jgi:trigger factor